MPKVAELRTKPYLERFGIYPPSHIHYITSPHGTLGVAAGQYLLAVDRRLGDLLQVGQRGQNTRCGRGLDH